MDNWFRQISHLFGYEAAVRIEDITVWLTGVLLGNILAVAWMLWLWGSVRSAELDGILATKVQVPGKPTRYYIDAEDFPDKLAAMLAVLVLKCSSKKNIRRKDLRMGYYIVTAGLLISVIFIAWGAYTIYHVIPKEDLIKMLNDSQEIQLHDGKAPTP